MRWFRDIVRAELRGSSPRLAIRLVAQQEPGLAGDWIKMRTALRNDPAVIRMAAALSLDCDTIVGKLHRIWSWATDHLADGNARGVTKSFIDAHVEVLGFAGAMESAGWLHATNDGLRFPRWDRHLSKGSKNRALMKRRVELSRARNGNARTVTKALPEKRRINTAAAATRSRVKTDAPDEPPDADRAALERALHADARRFFAAADWGERLRIAADSLGLDAAWLECQSGRDPERCCAALASACRGQAGKRSRQRNPAGGIARLYAEWWRARGG